MKVTLFPSIQELEKILAKGENRKILWNNQSYLIWRSYEDNYFLSEVFCPHQSYPLLHVKLGVASRISCPWHGFSFDNSTGQEREFRCRDLLILSLQKLGNELVLLDKL